MTSTVRRCARLRVPALAVATALFVPLAVGVPAQAAVPRTATGGGTLDELTFTPPGASAPTTSQAIEPALFSPNGSHVLFGWYEGDSRWWLVREVGTGKQASFPVGYDGGYQRDVLALANDGRTVLMRTSAALVDTDTNADSDLYLVHLAGGAAPRLVSRGPDGALGGASSDAVLSANGAYVAFVRYGEPGLGDRLLLADVAKGGVTDIGVADDGTPMKAFWRPAISSDGSVVAFTAERGAATDGSVPASVNLWDRGSGKARKISRDLGTGFQRWHATAPALDAAGRTVAYNFGHGRQLIAYDRSTGADRVLSVDRAGKTVSGAIFSDPAVSADGRYVAFTATSAALVPGDTKANRDVFRRDLTLGQTERVSLTRTGAETLFDTNLMGLSPSGLTVVFDVSASTIDHGERWGHGDAFVRAYPARHGAPDTTATRLPPARVNLTHPGIDLASGLSTTTFQCSTDYGAWKSCNKSWTAGPLTEGQHTLRARAVSEGGLIDPTPLLRKVVVDLTAPSGSIVAGPGTTTDRTPTFRFASSEKGSTFLCKLNLGSWKKCGATWTTPRLSTGSHTLQMRAYDAAGNPDRTAAKRTFRVK